METYLHNTMTISNLELLLRQFLDVMTGNAAQRILFAVEDKAVVRIDLKGSETDAGGNGVQNSLAVQQLSFYGVQIGIFASVPQISKIFCSADSSSAEDSFSLLSISLMIPCAATISERT